MRVIDRYVAWLFFKVFLLSCLCLTGIYMMGDFVENLNEFLDAADGNGGLLRVLSTYYVGRVPWFLDLIGRVAAMTAGVFAVTWLQRNNEMTALMAAGVSRWRIIRPIVVGVALVSVAAAVNRELVIPHFREDLNQDIETWAGEQASPISPQFDYMTDILLDGQEAIARDRKIIKPVFRLPSSMAYFAGQLAAESAVRLPATVDHPTGYLLEGVVTPDDLADREAVYAEGRPVIYTPRVAAWLEPDQCFVTSYVSFGQLLGGRTWRQFASTVDLIGGLKNPSTNFGADVRVSVHARILQPILDVTLFFLGIPLVIARESRNIFVSAGSCVLVVVFYFLVVIGFHGLGVNYLLQPAVAAWCPVLVLVPLAVLRSSPLYR